MNALLKYIPSVTPAPRRRGFTLLEMLVVVMILGILTAVAVPQYTRSVRRAEMVEGLTHGKTIYDAALRYKSVNSEVPTDFRQLDVSFLDNSVTGATFNDGNFSYILGAAGLTVQHNNPKDYHLFMQYPVVTSSGVSAPINCCPDNNSRDGIWLCKNASGNPGASGTGCQEIK